jgi:hypothetical protein
METAAIGALAEALTAQFDLLKSVFEGSVHILDTAIIGPQNLKQQEYLNRLRKALEFKDAYSGLYNEQLNTQRILLYAMLALIGLVILAAILKR